MYGKYKREREINLTWAEQKYKHHVNKLKLSFSIIVLEIRVKKPVIIYY
jgi:hypothetical protein